MNYDSLLTQANELEIKIKNIVDTQNNAKLLKLVLSPMEVSILQTHPTIEYYLASINDSNKDTEISRYVGYININDCKVEISCLNMGEIIYEL